jgi:hypothetical protein
MTSAKASRFGARTEGNKSPMGSTLKTLRRAEKRAARVQRRIWLAQLAFWPLLVVAAGAGAVATVVAIRRRSAGSEIGADTVPSVAPAQ